MRLWRKNQIQICDILRYVPFSSFYSCSTYITSVCSHFICILCAVLTQMPIGIRAAARAWDLQRMNIANKAMHAQAYKLHIHFSVDISTLFPIYTDNHNCSVCILAYRLELEFNCECHFWRFFFHSQVLQLYYHAYCFFCERDDNYGMEISLILWLNSCLALYFDIFIKWLLLKRWNETPFKISNYFSKLLSNLFSVSKEKGYQQTVVL